MSASRHSSALLDDIVIRFVLDGAACAVVPRTCTDADCVGSFELSGQRYSILKIGEDGAEDALDRLTPRELEIAMLIAAGQESKSVARRLRISFHTVRVHLGRIYAKLGLHKQTELAVLISSRYGALSATSQSPKRNTLQLSAMFFALPLLNILID